MVGHHSCSSCSWNAASVHEHHMCVRDANSQLTAASFHSDALVKHRLQSTTLPSTVKM